MCSCWLIFIVKEQTDTWIYDTTKCREWTTIGKFVILKTNWHQFFMPLSCYWSWISNNIVKLLCGSSQLSPHATLTIVWQNLWSITEQIWKKWTCSKLQLSLLLQYLSVTTSTAICQYSGRILPYDPLTFWNSLLPKSYAIYRISKFLNLAEWCIKL